MIRGRARIFPRAFLFAFSLLSCQLGVLKFKWHSLYIALPWRMDALEESLECVQQSPYPVDLDGVSPPEVRTREAWRHRGVGESSRKDNTSSRCPKENGEDHQASGLLDPYLSSCRSRRLAGVSTTVARLYPSPQFSSLKQNDCGRSPGRSPWRSGKGCHMFP